MKESELRKHTVCSLCKRKIGASGMPLFWVVEIQRFGLDLSALQRNTGLAMMLGNPQLASVMGPDEDLAKPIAEKVTLTVCEDCCTQTTCVAAMAEVTP
jgi:hypothetical protein